MQNSLDRLFDGLQETLRTVVAPSVADPYARIQVSAVAEILGNLATRVEWRSDELLELIARVRPILDLAGPAAGPLSSAVLGSPMPTRLTPSEDLLAARNAHLLALREVQHDRAGQPNRELDEAIRSFLAWQVDHESSLLRTGMFSAPKSAPDREGVDAR